jgi:hypothetical protein
MNNNKLLTPVQIAAIAAGNTPGRDKAFRIAWLCASYEALRLELAEVLNIYEDDLRSDVPPGYAECRSRRIAATRTRCGIANETTTGAKP